MDNFYLNIFKIIDSIGMCDKHKNLLVEKLDKYFEMNHITGKQYISPFQGSSGCCKGENNTGGCCKDTGNTSGCGC